MTDRDPPPPDDAALDALLDEATDAWDTPAEVPAGFADRVLAARAGDAEVGSPLPAPATAARPAWAPRRLAAPLFAAAAAAVLVLVVEHGPAFVPAEGQARTTDRTTLALADRAKAVAEPGAELTWKRSGGGLAVEQNSGAVFYRVDEGGPFVVTTPAGQVTVTGTCFTVEVLDMNTVSFLPKSHFLSGAVGAVLSAALVVTVYEGSVDVEAAGETVSLSAGERAAAAGEAPIRLKELKQVADERDAAMRAQKTLSTQNAELEAQLKRYMLAEANGTDPLVAENKRLREELSTLKRELDVEQELRSKQEGRPFEFPEDMPAAYRQEAMHAAVAEALAASGLPGDIDTVDCNEFPCMVQGETWAGGNTDATSAEIDDGYRKMMAELHKRFPEQEHSFSNSSWGDAHQNINGEDRRMRRFSISVYPKDAIADDQRQELHRRMRWRIDQLRESWPPPSE